MDLRSQLRNNLHGMGVRRVARPQPSAAQRSGQETTLNGNPLRARTVTNEPLGTGDSVFLASDSGVTQQERRKIVRAQEQRRALESSGGEVTCLVSRVVGGQTELYLGGDRPLTLIGIIPTNFLSLAELELVGPNKEDWIVALRYGQTAQMLSGNGSQDWIVSDDRVGYVVYRGNGFWSQPGEAYSANPAAFANTSSSAGGDLISLEAKLGTIVGDNCHTRIEGLSTIAVEYCENYSIVGARSADSESFDHREGIVTPTNSPFNFSGTNISNSESKGRAEWVGIARGPGYLGPGGSQVDPLKAPINGIQMFPYRVASGESTYTRNFSSQVYSVAIENGSITQNVGTRTLSTSATTQQNLSGGGGRKRIEWLGQVGEFADPHQFLWTIFPVDFENWPVINAGSSSTTNPVVAAISYDLKIAPNVTKRYSANITAPYFHPEKGTGSADYFYPANCCLGGYSWVKEKIRAPNPGDAVTDRLSGYFQFNTQSRTLTTYFTYQGQDIEANSTYGEISKTWQPSNTSFPLANSVAIPSSSDIFKKGTSAVVTLYDGYISGGKLSYTSRSQNKTVKVRKIPLENGSLHRARYWDLQG